MLSSREGLLVVVLFTLSLSTSSAQVEMSDQLLGALEAPMERMKLPVADQPQDVFACKGPHEAVNVIMRRRPHASANVKPKAKAQLCLIHPRNAAVLGFECLRMEEIFDRYPDWRCPLDADCFKGGEFRNAKRVAEATGDDKTCVEFVNKSDRFNQSVTVNFSIYIP